MVEEKTEEEEEEEKDNNKMRLRCPVTSKKVVDGIHVSLFQLPPEIVEIIGDFIHLESTISVVSLPTTSISKERKMSTIRKGSSSSSSTILVPLTVIGVQVNDRIDFSGEYGRDYTETVSYTETVYDYDHQGNCIGSHPEWKTRLETHTQWESVGAIALSAKKYPNTKPELQFYSGLEFARADVEHLIRGTYTGPACVKTKRVTCESETVRQSSSTKLHPVEIEERTLTARALEYIRSREESRLEFEIRNRLSSRNTRYDHIRCTPTTLGGYVTMVTTTVFVPIQVEYDDGGGATTGARKSYRKSTRLLYPSTFTCLVNGDTACVKNWRDQVIRMFFYFIALLAIVVVVLKTCDFVTYPYVIMCIFSLCGVFSISLFLQFMRRVCDVRKRKQQRKAQFQNLISSKRAFEKITLMEPPLKLN